MEVYPLFPTMAALLLGVGPAGWCGAIVLAIYFFIKWERPRAQGAGQVMGNPAKFRSILLGLATLALSAQSLGAGQAAVDASRYVAPLYRCSVREVVQDSGGSVWIVERSLTVGDKVTDRSPALILKSRKHAMKACQRFADEHSARRVAKPGITSIR